MKLSTYINIGQLYFCMYMQTIAVKTGDLQVHYIVNNSHIFWVSTEM